MSSPQSGQTMETKEQKVLRHVLSRPEAKGSPEKVLEAIEEFAKTTRLMIIGRKKGQVVLDTIRENEPTISLELGCYVGYSAILFGAELDKQNQTYSEKCNTPAKYYSFEVNKEFADIATQLVEYAGLSHIVEILVGSAGHNIPELSYLLKNKFKRFTPADVIFIDHAKELYVPDLRVLESSSFIAPDTLILADNIYVPGVPDYVRYVQSSPEYRRDHNDSILNVSNAECGGRWNILYDSHTVPVDDPERGLTDAVEVTRCVSYLSG